jgi:hypothetical protein
MVLYNTRISIINISYLRESKMQKNKDNKFIIINKYQIDYTQLLGKGGMASVYLGYYA